MVDTFLPKTFSGCGLSARTFGNFCVVSGVLFSTVQSNTHKHNNEHMQNSMENLMNKEIPANKYAKKIHHMSNKVGGKMRKRVRFILLLVTSAAC